MNPTPAGMPRDLLRRLRAHNYQTRTRRLELVREGRGALEGYTLEEIRLALPGRKLEWLTAYGTARNAVAHPDPDKITVDAADTTLSFLGHDGRMYAVAIKNIFTVSSKRIFHDIRAPRKVR